eukprot:g32871.t1
MNEEVLSVMKCINVDMSQGPNGIYPRILWKARDEIAGALLDTFANSLAPGKVPEDWKMASVIPLFKKGNKDDPVQHQHLHILVWRVLAYDDGTMLKLLGTHQQQNREPLSEPSGISGTGINTI